MPPTRPAKRSVSFFPLRSEKSSAKVLSTHTADYQEAFFLRRSVSTMAEVAKHRLISLVRDSANTAIEEQRAVRILSIGCGDGDLDLAVLESLNDIVDVEYLGLELNETSAKIFQESLAVLRYKFAGNFSFQIRVESAEKLLDSDRGFDLIVMSHVLYYFADPVHVIKNYLQRVCRIDGRLVIVHSGWDGIPQVMADTPGLQPFLYAEEIRDALATADLRVQYETLPSELDATDILGQTAKGRQVLSFCIERDVDRLPQGTQKHILKALWSRCEIHEDRAWLSESLAFLVLQNDLGFFSVASKSPIDTSCDPIEDYHQLACAFDWPSRLRSKNAPCRILDIGCGTGRWLTVLAHHWPDFKSLHGKFSYSAVDPSANSVEVTRAKALQWAQWERGWTRKLEDIQDFPATYYDIVWAMHSLYALSRPDLEISLTKILNSLKSDGIAIIAMPAKDSFYITAAFHLTNQPAFTSADDICAALRSLRLEHEVRHLDYEECIPAIDQLALRKYVWEESIGNSYSVATNGAGDLPELPSGSWFESYRRGDAFYFPQKIRVITIRGGQLVTAVRSRLKPSLETMVAWANVTTDIGVAEQVGLGVSQVIEDIPNALPPRWVHGEHKPAIQESPVLSSLARVLEEPLPEWGSEDIGSLLREEFLPLIRHGTRDNAPGYLGYIPSGGLYLGAIAEYLGATFNRYSAMFMASPGAATIEALSIRWLTEMTGIRASAEQSGSQSGGVFVSGASLATVTAVHAARRKAILRGKDPGALVAYFGLTAHCCMSQALSVCGIPHHRVIPVLADHCMDMDQLSSTISQDQANGLEPFFIALSAGEVETGAIDDIAQGRLIASELNAWLHVDGAYGAFFVLARSVPAVLRHISEADSLCLDPHKGMGLPYGTGALLVRNIDDLCCAFANAGSYLPSETAHDVPPDAMNLGIEMTRPFRGLRLWLPLKLIGIAPFRDHLEHMLLLARWLAEEIKTVPELELVNTPKLSICTFRLRAPATEQDNKYLLDEINADGRLFLTGCTLSIPEGGFALRAAILSFRTDQNTLQTLMLRIRLAILKLSRG